MAIEYFLYGFIAMYGSVAIVEGFALVGGDLSSWGGLANCRDSHSLMCREIVWLLGFGFHALFY
jgi:hypothetical protein